jgi:hypothetical protein
VSASGRLALLEDLLHRVRRNAARPRPVVAVAAAPAEAAPRPAAPVAAEPVVAAPVAPAPVAAVPVPAEPVAAAPVEASAEEVDRLTEPPLAVAPAAVAPGPIDELDEPGFGGESAVIPVDADAEIEVDGELSIESGELIDVTDLTPEEVATIEAEAAESAVAEAADRGEELGPASQPRARLESAVEERTDEERTDEEQEAPLQTPPPESGRQVAAPLHLPPQGAPPPDLGAARQAREREVPAMPTPEQLGQTIDLDEPLGGELELDEAGDAPTPPPPRDDLEHEPPFGAPGRYDADIELPPSAREDLARHQARDVPDRGSAYGRAGAPAAGPKAVVERPPLHAHPAEMVGVLPSAEPRTFLALLDGSLAL